MKRLICCLYIGLVLSCIYVKYVSVITEKQSNLVEQELLTANDYLDEQIMALVPEVSDNLKRVEDLSKSREMDFLVRYHKALRYHVCGDDELLNWAINNKLTATKCLSISNPYLSGKVKLEILERLEQLAISSDEIMRENEERIAVSHKKAYSTSDNILDFIDIISGIEPTEFNVRTNDGVLAEGSGYPVTFEVPLDFIELQIINPVTDEKQSFSKKFNR